MESSIRQCKNKLIIEKPLMNNYNKKWVGDSRKSCGTTVFVDQKPFLLVTPGNETSSSSYQELELGYIYSIEHESPLFEFQDSGPFS